MKVLVACEYSGIVRDAFSRKGHFAVSADILPTESIGYHYHGDVLNILNDGWDLMVAHPPCTYLTNAGNRWLHEDSAESTAAERLENREHAIRFFQELQNAPIDRIAIENPTPHGYVTDRVGMYHDKIQPWMFGHPEKKGICLWLKNLPPLMSTMTEQQRDPKVHWMGPSADRQKERSKFFTGIAEAMAEQWA